MTWRGPDGRVHVMEVFQTAAWPICYSKRHPLKMSELGTELPTCLWCVATAYR